MPDAAAAAIAYDPAPAPALAYDASSALSQGKRATQEDAIVADFSAGAGFGVVVLSDGMGGHNAGDVASNIVVTQVYSEIKRHAAAMLADRRHVPGVLRHAADLANASILRHTSAYPGTHGMGATLIALVQLNDTLSWISIGDSVLYLYRAGQLYQLNQDHSLAPQIDYLVTQGIMTEEAARDHPDRNCLISALLGEEIPFIDCPETPLQLRPGDIVLAASDGLPTLGRTRIEDVLYRHAASSAATMAEALIRSVEWLDAPEQDNVCLSVIRAAAPGVGPLPAIADGVQTSGLFGRLKEFGSGWLK